MAIPNTRETFKQYCLRKLGSPVIEINVSDDQIEDRIDEAISYWNDFHFSGSDRIFLKHQITANTISNSYIDIPSNINGVVRIFDIGGSTTVSSASSANIFSAKYQFFFTHISDIASYNLTNYYLSMQHLALIDELLVGKAPIRYNRHINKLYLDVDTSILKEGNYIVVECYQSLDGNTYPDMWSDRWLQNYTTAKIKKQWGENLTKFVGMQLPGGVQFNGEFILNEAKEEIQKLEDEMLSTYSLPSTDFIY